jgi:prepilin-type N-terminal cleavage/methylation domain-containing protein
MRQRKAFSLVELLVVIGIMLVIASIALPMLIRSYSRSDAAKQRMDLNTIALALNQYKQDFGDYPRPDAADVSGERGARILCWALIAPQDATGDGADGLGFRVRKDMGKPHPPYIQPDRLKVSATDATGKITNKDGGAILYYPASPIKADVTQGTNYCGTAATSLYNSADNVGLMTEVNLRALLGDWSVNGRADVGLALAAVPPKFAAMTVTEQPVTGLPFLLVSPGPDGLFGATGIQAGTPDAKKWTENKAAVAASDDIVNFDR